jgi:condensin complex subunit 1
MENPIFRKLQEAVEQPCRSKEWFPLAEQALNTVYALGDHPDELCNELIKNLTRCAFTTRPPKAAAPPRASTPKERDPDAMDQDEEPGDEQEANGAQADVSFDSSQPQSRSDDVGDAFELSKLLFVVGHVAIKHIAFLELVEREWKRQKDEKQAG